MILGRARSSRADLAQEFGDLAAHSFVRSVDFADVFCLFRKWNQRVSGALTTSFMFSLGVYREKQMLVGVLVTFLVVILILYLINLLPLDGRAKQICRVIVIILGVISLLRYIAVF